MESNTETVQNENPILGAVMVCHPPIIVPNVGQGKSAASRTLQTPMSRRLQKSAR
ncbi:hypothetical protein [Allobaculum sp. Allo2]|uniref:hypothetical protein n=1 Tax=Allobaculum sp. Allo2 TaxID=2853432 RepID=UPI001F6071F0|nr:hypothetical protein [Allobaculum sp. Allo2]UNT92500.1 hypothetical protein KWG61_10060 [Allobaculum sp. Allo2]